MKTTTTGADGKPTVKSTVKSTPRAGAGQAKPPSGGSKLPVTGVEIAGLVVLAGATIALGMALVTWRRRKAGRK
ncbi:MAG TPA: LPXTG cell wall anchor domain-containing protein [Corynebacterium sp.]|uniref:LPXTG cell wall anchor domain-containing protein n=1 Tax=Corynebacterium sp. TaxID=1720 RepID=UPI0015E0D081|nr:LPXTG cell wall anchor domain-containing protein [Corynebacterium sp.]HHT31536.1 LPXTG cell wall anchor domain-containing protein [Corynebacterium sp.]